MATRYTKNYSQSVNLDTGQLTKYYNTNVNESYSINGFGIFSIIIILLLFISVLTSLVGTTEVFTFSDFFSWFTDPNFPTIDIKSLIWEDLKIVQDWGVFNFFRDFINFNIVIVNIVYFIARALASTVETLFFFIAKIFAL